MQRTGLFTADFTARRTLICLAGVLLLAAVLRCWNNTPSFYSFWLDEAAYANRSIYILNHQGAYDLGFLRDHPPLYMYLQAVVFKLFGTQWYVARGLAVSLGVLTVAVLFLIGKAWRGERFGLVLAAIFAVAPVMVDISRQVLLENLMFLFLSVAVLSLIRFDKTGKRTQLLLVAVFFGLAALTKLTALLFVFPLAVYIIARHMQRDRGTWLAAAVFLLMVLPVIALMIPQGVLQMHLQKAGGAGVGYYIGGTFVDFGHLAALLMTLTNLNIGILAFAVYAWTSLRGPRERPVIRGLIRWSRANTLTMSLAIWAGASLMAFSALTFITSQYIETILFPVMILLGLVVYRQRHLFIPVFGIFLLVTAIVVGYTGSRTASNETVEYLQAHVRQGDVLVASDAAVFSYYFPGNEVRPDSPADVAGSNATYLVLKTDIYDKLTHNSTVEGLMVDGYVQVFLTHEGPHAINFIVLRNVG